MLTEQEETILRLMVAELKARKKLDILRAAKAAEIRTATILASHPINSLYQEQDIDLFNKFIAAEKAIEDACK